VIRLVFSNLEAMQPRSIIVTAIVLALLLAGTLFYALGPRNQIVEATPTPTSESPVVQITETPTPIASPLVMTSATPLPGQSPTPSIAGVQTTAKTGPAEMVWVLSGLATLTGVSGLATIWRKNS
jgi:hypothetical protein